MANIDVEDRASAVLEFENGIIGSAYASWCCPLEDNVLEIGGTEGALVAQRTIGPYDDGHFTIYRPGRKPDVVKLKYVSHYESELRHFVECIRAGKPSEIVSGEISLHSERARAMAYEDARQRWDTRRSPCSTR